MTPPFETEATVDLQGRDGAAKDDAGAEERLGRYRLDGVLGRGGMGIVYRAHDPDLERQVALKVLRASGDSDARARLLREARAMAQLSHPNVITVYEVGSAGGRDYVAMELIDGGSLDEWLRTRRPLDQVLDIFVHAGRGLAAAHGKGLVHRDFKPHNVLVAGDGRVIVTDFGLARSADIATDVWDRAETVDNTSSRTPGLPTPPTPAVTPATAWASTITETGAVVGTPAYMAPEQWEHGVVDPRTDQFSFCVALWEAVAGARPYIGDLVALRTAVSMGPPPPAPDVPAWLDAILRRGLAPAADDRWPSMDAMIAAITRGRGARRRRQRNVALGLGAAIAIACAVAFVVTGDARSPAPAATASTSALEARILKHLGALLPLPTAPGNAADEYLAVMRAQPRIDARFAKVASDDERARMDALAADPVVLARVAQLRRAASKRDCALVGTLVPWGERPKPFAVAFPDAQPLLAHTGVLRYLAGEKAKAGQLDAAKRDLEAIVWIGWHLQQEPVLLYNMVGVAFSADASEQLAELDPDAGRAGRWRVLAGLFRGRRYDDYADRQAEFQATSLDPDAIDRRAAVVDDPDALPGARAEAMHMVAIAHLLQTSEATPTARQREHVSRWTRLADPRLRDLAVRLAPVLDLDATGRADVRRFYLEQMK